MRAARPARQSIGSSWRGHNWRAVCWSESDRDPRERRARHRTLLPTRLAMTDGVRLLLALVLTALLVLSRHHVTCSEPRDLRSAGSGDMLSGEIDNYLSDLKDFYTKVGRPRFGKRSTRVRRWRTVTSLGDVIHELRF